MKLLGNTADRLLSRFVPKETAAADATWYEWCSPCKWVPSMGNYARLSRQCHVVGGISGCGPCNLFNVPC